MAIFIIAGRTINLPAVRLGQLPTKKQEQKAWVRDEYVTVQLLEPVEGIRVHTDGRAFRDRPASGAEGIWVNIGDAILTCAEMVDRSALPGSFTHTAEVTILPGTVINVGVNAAALAGRGGGIQAEHVRGPWPKFNQLTGKHWMAREGHA